MVRPVGYMAEIQRLVTQYASHQIYLERLAATEGAKVMPFIKNIEARIAAILFALPDKRLTPAKQQKVIDEITLITKEELTAYTRGLTASNKELGAYEAEYAARAITDVISTEDYEAKIPKSSVVYAEAIGTPIKLGDNLYTTYTRYVNQYHSKYADQINGIALQAFQSNQANQQIASQILAQIKSASNLEGATALTKAAREAKTLARTSTNHFATSAKLAFGDANDDVITGYRSIGTIDNRTSQVCRSYDQEVRSKKDKDWSGFQTPRHPNCRSSLVPEVSGKYKYDDSASKRPSNLKVDGTRDPKRVSSKQTYYESLKQLNAADQDAILGPTLGKAFRKLDDPEAFASATIDTLGNPLTITQMKARDNELSRVLNNL